MENALDIKFGRKYFVLEKQQYSKFGFSRWSRMSQEYDTLEDAQWALRYFRYIKYQGPLRIIVIEEEVKTQ